MTLRHNNLSPVLRRLRARTGATTVIGTSLLFSMAGCLDEPQGQITGDTVGDIAADNSGSDGGSNDTNSTDVVSGDTKQDVWFHDIFPKDTSVPDSLPGDTWVPDSQPVDTWVPDNGQPLDIGVTDIGQPMDTSTTDVVADQGSVDIVTTDGGPADVANDAANDAEVCEEPDVTAAELLGTPCKETFYLALCADDGSGKTAVYCGGDGVWVEPTPGDFCEYCNPVPCDFDFACLAVGYIGISRARAHKAGVSTHIA